MFRRRLRERMEESVYSKQTKILEIRKRENISKIEERDEEKIKRRNVLHNKQLMLDRLAILNNIAIGSDKNKNTNYY